MLPRQRKPLLDRTGALPDQRLLGADLLWLPNVVAKGFVDPVVILCGGEEIARHPRCYGDATFVAYPLHHLALIETKPGGARSGRRASGLEPSAALPATASSSRGSDGQQREARVHPDSDPA